MKFTQTNNNGGDVNNNIVTANQTVHNGDVNTATANNGSVAQGVGTENKVQVTQPKEDFWAKLGTKLVGAWKWVIRLFGFGGPT